MWIRPASCATWRPGSSASSLEPLIRLNSPVTSRTRLRRRLERECRGVRVPLPIPRCGHGGPLPPGDYPGRAESSRNGRISLVDAAKSGGSARSTRDRRRQRGLILRSHRPLLSTGVRGTSRGSTDPTNGCVQRSRRSNSVADMRQLAKYQMLGLPVSAINWLVNKDLRARYEKAGILEIMPGGRFDIRRHQLIPGRSGMIRNFGRIERHHGEVKAIRGHALQLTNDKEFETDLLLWGTGYAADLDYLGVDAISMASGMMNWGDAASQASSPSMRLGCSCWRLACSRPIPRHHGPMHAWRSPSRHM